MKIVKQSIQKFLSSFGWELSKIEPPPPSEMTDGLQWLRNAGVQFQTIIDVGASDGNWSLECMNCFSEQNYLLLEPNPDHSESLDAFVKAHPNCIADKRAVGPEDGRIQFNVGDLWGGAMDPEGKADTSIEVPMTTLDSCIKKSELPGSYMIKLDTHGFEEGILNGADEVLKETDALVIECYNFEIEPGALRFWEMCSYLCKKGFRPVRIVDVLNRNFDQALWQMDIFFLRESWDGFKTANYR